MRKKFNVLSNAKSFATNDEEKVWEWIESLTCWVPYEVRDENNKIIERFRFYGQKV